MIDFSYEVMDAFYWEVIQSEKCRFDANRPHVVSQSE